MKTHTQGFKNQIKEMGRELDSIISYDLNGETVELRNEDLNSVTPHYEANILKSVMKQLDLDSNVDIPLNTVINYKFGLKVGSEYEYLDFGNYVIYSSEKQEDTRSYKIVCYDKMLYAMKNYEKFTDEYPMSINDYTDKLCQHLGLVFKNKNDNYANKDKIIENELYLSDDGEDIGYTYRDVFDELAQVTASTIVINEETDEVEIRYINDTNDIIDEEYLKDTNINFGEKYGVVNSIVLSRAGDSDSVYLRDEESVETNGLCEIKISENQIMNFNNRSDFLPDILAKLNGLEYFTNDYESYGVTYYNVCDRYNVKIGDNTYSCVMFNDEAKITKGLSETIYCDMPDGSETEYSKSDTTDRRINQTYLIVNKQEGIIEGVVSETKDLKDTVDSNYTELRNNFNNYAPNSSLETLTNEVRQITTSGYTKTEVNQIVSGIGVDGVKVTYVTTEQGIFDNNGLTIDRTNSPTKGRFNEDGLRVILKLANGEDGDVVLEAIYNQKTKQSEVNASNLRAKNFLLLDNISRFQNYMDGNQIKTGCFWIYYKMPPFPVTVSQPDGLPEFYTYNEATQTVTTVEGASGSSVISLILNQTVYNVEIDWLRAKKENGYNWNITISLHHTDNTTTNYVHFDTDNQTPSNGKFTVPIIKKGEVLTLASSFYNTDLIDVKMTIVSYE